MTDQELEQVKIDDALKQFETADQHTRWGTDIGTILNHGEVLAEAYRDEGAEITRLKTCFGVKCRGCPDCGNMDCAYPNKLDESRAENEKLKRKLSAALDGVRTLREAGKDVLAVRGENFEISLLPVYMERPFAVLRDTIASTALIVDGGGK